MKLLLHCLVTLAVCAAAFAADEKNPNKVAIANSGLTREQAGIFQRLAWETVTREPLTGVTAGTAK